MSETIKKNLLGLAVALGFTLLSVLIFPLYITPVGFVWVVALFWIRARFGAVPAYVCALFLTGAAQFLFGGWGALFVAGVTVVAITSGILAMRPGVKVEYSALAVMFSLLLTIVIAIFLVQRAFGDAVAAIVDYIRRFMNMVPGLWDTYMHSIAESAGISNYTLEDMLYEYEQALRFMLTAQLVCYCLYGAAFGVLTARKVAAAQGNDEQYGTKFDLYKWTLPKYTGRTLAAAALLLYLLAQFAFPSLISAAFTVWQVLYALFILLGFVHLAFTLKMKGIRPIVRWMLLIGMYLIFKPVLFISGILDRILPLRRDHDANIILKIGRMGGQMPDASPPKEEEKEEDNGKHKDE